jgi:hypothetical protein
MGYYRNFFKNYGKIAAPLTMLLKRYAFIWTPAVVHAFQDFKLVMCTPPFLSLPDFSKTFVLECDASRKGIGVVLIQDGRPLAFTNKQFFENHFGQSTYEKEILVILHYADLWHPYLLGK